MAPAGNGPVTGGFQPKNDFFGPSLVLTPLTALETPKNFGNTWPYAITLPRTQIAPKIDPFGGFLALGLTSINWEKWGESRIFNV